MDPPSPELSTKFQQAFALQKRGELAAAQSLYEEILRARPQHFDALHLLGIIAAQTSDPGKALQLFDRAIAANPRSAAAHGNRGSVLYRLRRLEAALASFDRALAIEPRQADALMNRGNALKDLQRWNEALASYDRALAIKPNFAEALSNSSYVLKEMGRLDAALARYSQAIAIRPEYVSAHVNRALTLLLTGDFANGWSEYEWRRKLEPPRFTQPYWLGGEPIAGKTVLLHAEQGLGDTLQFCRYASLVAELGARVILAVQKPLVTLLSGLPGVSQTTATSSSVPSFDHWCALMSLPLAFKTRLDTVPFPQGYLTANAEKSARWQTRLSERSKPRVGLVWSGSPTSHNDRNRSIALADLLRCLPAEFQYVSLQKELREPDARTLAANPQILNFTDELVDFDEAAALCGCLDLVISVDTSVAHLSGALGLRTWLLLPFNVDWRWLLRRSDSPWYSTMTLYRQTTLGDWSGVFAAIAQDLQAFDAVSGSEAHRRRS